MLLRSERFDGLRVEMAFGAIMICAFSPSHFEIIWLQEVSSWVFQECGCLTVLHSELNEAELTWDLNLRFEHCYLQLWFSVSVQYSTGIVFHKGDIGKFDSITDPCL